MDHPIKIDTSLDTPPSKKRRGWLFWLLALAVSWIAIELVGVSIPMWAGRKADRQNMTAEASAPQVNLEASQSSVDESRLQWKSPTSGPPITLEYVPRGAQVIMHLRPAELMAHSEGEKVLAALGWLGERAARQIEEFTGSPISDIETLLVAWIRVDDRWNYSLRATFPEARTDATSVAAERTAYFPPAGQGRVLVSAPSGIAEELKEHGDSPALLARDLERLLPLTDQHRTAALLMPTNFLETQGPELFTGSGEKLIAAFNALVPDNATAVMLSCDWGQDFFCELAATILQNSPSHRFNAELAERLAAAENQLAATLATNPPHAYGLAVEARFPAMLRMMSDFTRVSSDHSISIARSYLPAQAGHNLLLASRLRLSSLESEVESEPFELSLADRLRQVTTLSFPRETLENALATLAADAELPIQIAGRNLQLEGITKNQVFSLDLRDRPVADILLEVLRRANPDREAMGPDDPRQKLVYVIHDNAVIVTTRAAVKSGGDELPEVFRVKEH